MISPLRCRLVAPALLIPALVVGVASAAEAATLRPNTTMDEMTASDGKCSLREAVDAVNSPGTKTDCGTASAVSNVIVLRAKTYQLSIPPASTDTDQNCVSPPALPPSDQNASGDLCVTSNAGLTIVGRGPMTVIAGQSSFGDRLMTIAPQASVALVELKLKGGHAPDGTSEAATCPPNLPVLSNSANGGAVYNTGSLTTNVVTFKRNRAGAGASGTSLGTDGSTGGDGGGIYNQHSSACKFPGSLTIQNSTFIENVAGAGGAGGDATSGSGGIGGSGGSGGGIANDSGSVTVLSSTFASNQAGAGGRGGTGGSGSGAGGNGGVGSPGGGIFSTGGSLSVTNTTLSGNQAGSGGSGGTGGSGGNGGNGGGGANGGGVAVSKGASRLLNATVASNEPGVGGAAGTGQTNGTAGGNGSAGGIFVQSSKTADNLKLQNTIVASSNGLNCLGSPTSAIANRGHNLSFPDLSCPAATNGDPKLKPLNDYGGYTLTLALGRHSAAINRVPRNGAGCPSVDQRGVKRPQGKACDIGAFEFARPRIQIDTPRNGARYKRGSRVLAFFVCSEGGIYDRTITPIASCKGTVANGKRIDTSTLGRKSFKVTAIDKSGNKVSKTVHYTVVR